LDHSIISIYFKKVEWVAKVKQNFERRGNVKFIVPASLTLENIEKQWESRILIHTVCHAQSCLYEQPLNTTYVLLEVLSISYYKKSYLDTITPIIN